MHTTAITDAHYCYYRCTLLLLLNVEGQATAHLLPFSQHPTRPLLPSRFQNAPGSPRL